MSFFRLPFALYLTITLAAFGQTKQSTTQHVEQFELLKLVKEGKNDTAFLEAEEAGNEHFATGFSRSDGVGANIRNDDAFSIFTRTPRADLRGPGEWFNHFPARITGPNGQGCAECHNQPVEDGGGTVVANVVRDPFRTTQLNQFISRNAPHVMAMAGPQLLAEEMTAELGKIREAAISKTCAKAVGGTQTSILTAKDVNFGTIKVTRRSAPRGTCSVTLDLSGRSGIDADLVVKPFQWKGITRFVRDFSRSAANNELGMQPVELLRHPKQDGDFDGIINEFSVGDLTALAIYNAAQPRPVTRLELAALGLDSLSQRQRNSIARGTEQFTSMGCASCHTPRLTVNNPVFSEPSRHREFRDTLFPAGLHPLVFGLDPVFPITFNITRDNPGNIIRDSTGRIIARLGSFRADASGRAIVELYSDLKRHDLGDGVREDVDETASPVEGAPGTFVGGVGRSVFLTRPLWGVGSTLPYMHDGNSPTIPNAINRHNGEAEFARRRYRAATVTARADLLAFMNNLILFKPEEENEAAVEPNENGNAAAGAVEIDDSP